MDLSNEFTQIDIILLQYGGCFASFCTCHIGLAQLEFKIQLIFSNIIDLMAQMLSDKNKT